MIHATPMTIATRDSALEQKARAWLLGALHHVQHGICPMCDDPADADAGSVLCGALLCARLSQQMPAPLWWAVEHEYLTVRAAQDHAASLVQAGPRAEGSRRVW